jgi:uncharacterized membrane protein
MTTVSQIKSRWKLGAIASQAVAGIALTTGWWSLAGITAQALPLPFPRLEQSQVASASPMAQSPPQPWAPQTPLHLAAKTATPANHTRRLRVHNLCHQAIELVVRYQDRQQEWATQGGWRISGKTSGYLTSPTAQAIELSQRVLYYYAEASDSDLVWTGTGSYRYPFGQETLNMRIHYAAVDILDDYSLFILCNPDE